MARSMSKSGTFEIEYLDDFTVEVVPKMVEAGVKILEAEVKKRLDAVIGWDLKHESKSTGALQKSVSASHTFIRAGGVVFKANVYFREGGDRKKNHGFKAAILEYGAVRAKRGEVVATGFATRAIEASRGKIEAEMERVLDAELSVY